MDPTRRWFADVHAGRLPCRFQRRRASVSATGEIVIRGFFLLNEKFKTKTHGTDGKIVKNIKRTRTYAKTVLLIMISTDEPKSPTSGGSRRTHASWTDADTHWGTPVGQLDQPSRHEQPAAGSQSPPLRPPSLWWQAVKTATGRRKRVQVRRDASPPSVSRGRLPTMVSCRPVFTVHFDCRPIDTTHCRILENSTRK